MSSRLSNGVPRWREIKLNEVPESLMIRAVFSIHGSTVVIRALSDRRNAWKDGSLHDERVVLQVTTPALVILTDCRIAMITTVTVCPVVRSAVRTTRTVIDEPSEERNDETGDSAPQGHSA